MQLLKKCAATITVISIVGFALAILAPEPARGAAGPQMTIVNTPLPVTGNVNATVTGNVGLTGTPTVMAQQSGPWNVGITGSLPPFAFAPDATVNVGNTPTVNIGTGSVEITGTPSVEIVNQATSPVLTRDVDRPGRQRYVSEKTVICHDGAFFCGTESFAAVPSGKRLVVEYVWARADLPAGQTPLVDMYTGVNLPITLPLQVHFFGTDIFTGGGPMPVHVDSGGYFLFNAQRNATVGTGGVFITVSGYLIDVP